ncbi:MAG TPA: glycerol kinase GlpK [Acidimicrobiales bacterium]|nr:glycerol kinase GlpK [Acidimicrobiales bacterium]
MALVLALDAGTTGVRSLAFDDSGRPVASSYREFPQYFPRPGWVEHDPVEIWEAQAATIADLLARIDQPVAAIGITNQRETVVVWDRRTGRPLAPAIVWQDRRTADECERLRRAGHLPTVRQKTGLVLDPYFSATKLGWLFRSGAVEAGPDVAFGTVDTWLVWCLTGGKVHATDHSNASRTLLFDIDRLAWDTGLCELFGVPDSALPDLVPSSGRMGVTAGGVVAGLPAGVPISGCAGDQQAALFGQACFEPGMTKNTYGTGSFVLMNVGPDRPPPVEGLLTTVAWTLGASPAPAYALEGAIFVTGAAVQWLRDQLGLIGESAEIGPLAASVADSGGAYLVPAFTGLGSPWWDPEARGTLVGLTRGVGRAQLARAALDAMAFQTRDVVDSMVAAGSTRITELRVDGGASVVDLLLQLQADLTGVPVVRAAVQDTTALGAALLAGLAEGVWSSLDEIARNWHSDRTFTPAPDTAQSQQAYEGWLRAVERARGWGVRG